MQGTRQGDFSRAHFAPEKHYKAVHLQQGRVLLDSDWNAETDLIDHRIATESIDVVGRSGAPAEGGGFKIEAESAMELGPDRHYIAIGGSEGCRFKPSPPPEEGYTVELRLQPWGDGTLWSRRLRGDDGVFREVERLELADGRLRFVRPGGVRVLETEPGALAAREPGRRDQPSADVAVTIGPESVRLHLDGAALVTEKTALLSDPERSYPLEGTVLLIGAAAPEDGFEADEPRPDLPGLVEEIRLWSGPRTGEEIRRWTGRRSAEDVRRTLDAVRDAIRDGRGSRVLGFWRLLEARGGRLEDATPHCNHGVVRGAATPPRWHALFARITAGRYYAGGLLCANERTVAFDAQADLPGAVFPAPPAEGDAFHLIYLDAWEREITAVEDPSLREIALGGPTTTTRSRVIAQVRSLPVASEVDRFTQLAELPEWRALVDGEGQRGTLQARRNPVSGTALDNSLYRIQVHDGGVAGGDDPEAPTATFKWSRDNGSEVYAIESLSDAPSEGKKGEDDAPPTTLVTVSLSGQRDLCIEEGGWVEVCDDATALAPTAPGPLLQVLSVDAMKRQVVLAGRPPLEVGRRRELHPSLRIWHQSEHLGEILPSGLVPVRHDAWLPLEAGIEVRFAAGELRSGDFWWIVARQSSQRIEWPRDAGGLPSHLPPDGVAHHYGPLALLSYTESGFRLAELRPRFQPLTTGAVSKAGDAMDGPLEVHADAAVLGDLVVEGRASFGEIVGPLCSRDIVDTPHLVDGAVTRSKLSPDVGFIPPGFSIFGPSPESPPGFTYTGAWTTLFSEDPPWTDRLEVPNIPPGPIYSAAVGGKIYSFQESGDAWEVDPAANAWRRLRDMPWHRRRFAAAAAGGRIYVAGGLDASGRCRDSFFEYDPETDTWQELESMPSARCDLALVSFDGRLHALGGLRNLPIFGKWVSRRHEVYDPATQTWTRRRDLPQARSRLAAAALGNQIHIAGGETRWLLRLFGHTLLARHHVYHPATDTWVAEEEPLPAPRRDLALVTVFGKLYAVGGDSSLGRLADCDQYDPGTRRWRGQTRLHEPLDQPGVVEVGGSLYVTGARRSPDARGVLVEECRVASRFYVHERLAVAPRVAPPPCGLAEDPPRVGRAAAPPPPPPAAAEASPEPAPEPSGPPKTGATGATGVTGAAEADTESFLDDYDFPQGR